MISVAIVDSKRDIRDGIRALLEATEDITCTDVFATAMDAQQGILKNPPTVVLLNLNLPDQTGIELIGVLIKQQPNLNIIVHTDITDKEVIFQSLQAGAIGYILNHCFPSELIRAIKEAARGGAPLSPEISRRVVATFSKQNDAIEALSEREHDVLVLLCEGLSYKEIGERLFVSANTVRFHLKNIYRKLGVKSRYEAVAKSVRAGLLVLS